MSYALVVLPQGADGQGRWIGIFLQGQLVKVLDGFQERLRVERLWQDIVHADGEVLFHVGLGHVRGHGDDWSPAVELSDAFRCLHAVQRGQLHVHEDEIKIPGGHEDDGVGAVGDNLQVVAAGDGGHGAEETAQQLLAQGIVLDNQDLQGPREPAAPDQLPAQRHQLAGGIEGHGGLQGAWAM